MGTARPHPCYGDRALSSWAERLVDYWPKTGDGFVFFNNDPRACALRDARWFALAARRAGIDCTRIPAASDVRLG